ncbi:ABC transporter substrate-binding protein [Ramlibacter tataouinensis]|uniref:Bicyclomycin resistance protein n=1 Tax=Ramlibacter tataouinensis TaxID=94132 RepID=A0A127JVR4_9BURK|nr:ABC transporter substrate-binding protein [Ramlibacter tataouinensis]AMO23995.1 bicyclomycin resistance protein [Ramlibacter tataouinensis]
MRFEPLRTAQRAALMALACLALAAPAQAAPEKVLRYAFPVAETGFDPAQLNDLYSRIITANMFDALYGYDYLARPARIKPVLADGMPVISPDFKTYTVKMRRGIYFADDPAFEGRRREVTAADVVFSYKRIMDPRNKSPLVSGLEEEKILGLSELRKKALAGDARFDYDTEIEGLRALDRYTVQFKLGEPRPRFTLTLADPGIFGVVAREVIEKYGDAIMEHPVGTGPFMLKEWRRSSKITLVRNPGYREQLYDAQPPANDPQSQALAAKMKGRRLPMIDRVEVSIIDDPQPRWLSFLNNEHDFMERLPENFATHAIPNNKLAPNLAKRGIQMERVPLSDIRMVYFSMLNPVVGGYTPEKVALRRAIALAMDSKQEAQLAMRGQAMVAQGFIMPNTNSFDADFRSEMGTHDRAKAVALLDMFGYTDKDGDGWRDQPNGQPLELVYDTLSAADYRERDEVMKKNLDAVGIKLQLRIGKWPEQLRNSRAGKLMMWGYGLSASSPDSAGVLALGYSGSFGQQNHSRFKNDKFDELYRQQAVMADGPERDAVIREAVRIMIAYMPIKVRVHRIGTDMMQPWLLGYKRHPNAREFWQYVDIDTDRLPQK